MKSISRATFALTLLCFVGCSDVNNTISNSSSEHTTNVKRSNTNTKYYTKVSSKPSSQNANVYSKFFNTKLLGKGTFSEAQMLKFIQTNNIRKHNDLLANQNNLKEIVKTRLYNKKYYRLEE